MEDRPFVGSKCTVLLCSSVANLSLSFSLPVLNVCLALHFFLSSFLQKYTQRKLSTHLKVWVLIIFTQLKWCFDEHTNEHSPHAGPLSVTLCSGTWYLWAGRWWKEKVVSVLMSSSPLSDTKHHNTGQTHFLLRSAIKAIAPALLTHIAMLPWWPSARCLSLLDSIVTSYYSWQQTCPALITDNMEAVG